MMTESMACASSSTPAIPSSSLIERLRFLPGLACNIFGHPPMLVPDDTWTSSCFMHSSATENDEKLSHLANERIHKISGIFFGFFSFLSENLTWNGKSKLKFVLGSLSSSPGRVDT